MADRLALDTPTPAKPATLPKPFAERLHAIRATLAATSEPLSADAVRARFKGARQSTVEDMLQGMVALGSAQGRYFLTR